MISKRLTTTPSPSFILFYFFLTTEIDFERRGCGDFFAEYNPDVLNLNPLAKETADLGAQALLIMPYSASTSYTHRHMSVSVPGSSPMKEIKME